MGQCDWCGRTYYEQYWEGSEYPGWRFCSEKCMEEKRQADQPIRDRKAAERAELYAQIQERKNAGARQRAEAEAEIARQNMEKENARPEIQQRIGRPVKLDDIWYHCRLGRWVYREEILAEYRAFLQYHSNLLGFPVDKLKYLLPDDECKFQWDGWWPWDAVNKEWLPSSGVSLSDTQKEYGPPPGGFARALLSLITIANYLRADPSAIENSYWRLIYNPALNRYEAVDFTAVYKKFDEMGKKLGVAIFHQDPVYDSDKDKWVLKYSFSKLEGVFKKKWSQYDKEEDVTHLVTIRLHVDYDKVPVGNFDYTPFDRAILGLPAGSAAAAAMTVPGAGKTQSGANKAPAKKPEAPARTPSLAKPPAPKTQSGAKQAAPACASCGAALKSGAKFCSKCGAKQAAAACASCGAALKSGAKFCSKCGTKTAT